MANIVFIVNHAAFFVSHRLPIAIAAREVGHCVKLITGLAGSATMEPAAEEALRAARFPHERVPFSSSGTNPFKEMIALFQLTWLVRRQKPDLVHCVSPKGVLYGGLAARLCRTKSLVIAFSGMGFAFTDSDEYTLRRRCLRLLLRNLMSVVLSHPNIRVIVQNSHDEELAKRELLVPEAKITKIPGSGVDLTLFSQCSAQNKENIVLFPARVVGDKGVREFIAAARTLKARLPHWRFVIAGAADYNNPTSLSAAETNGLKLGGAVEWIGHVNDMTSWFRKAAVVCLPSYREGLPKALIEAAAASCAVVTTDTPGCRDAIVPGVSGDLVPARDVTTLSQTLSALLLDASRRIDYGSAGRKLAEERFSIDRVIEETLGIYRALTYNGTRQI